MTERDWETSSMCLLSPPPPPVRMRAPKPWSRFSEAIIQTLWSKSYFWCHVCHERRMRSRMSCKRETGSFANTKRR